MSNLDCLFFLVSHKSVHVITQGRDREDAKRNAAKYLLLGNPDEYTVTPLTGRGERVYLNLQVRND